MRALFSSCLLLLSCSLIGAQSEPVKLAGSARFDLSAGAGVRSLDDGQVKGGFRSWNEKTNQPGPAMREALFWRNAVKPLKRSSSNL
jgi:hypothetical protein